MVWTGSNVSIWWPVWSCGLVQTFRYGVDWFKRLYMVCSVMVWIKSKGKTRCQCEGVCTVSNRPLPVSACISQDTASAKQTRFYSSSSYTSALSRFGVVTSIHLGASTKYLIGGARDSCRVSKGRMRQVCGSSGCDRQSTINLRVITVREEKQQEFNWNLSSSLKNVNETLKWPVILLTATHAVMVCAQSSTGQETLSYQEIHRISRTLKAHYRVHKRQQLNPKLSYMHLVCTHTFPFLKMKFNITPTSKHRLSNKFSSVWGFLQTGG
jgi:hypothetical protein